MMPGSTSLSEGSLLADSETGDGSYDSFTSTDATNPTVPPQRRRIARMYYDSYSAQSSGDDEDLEDFVDSRQQLSGGAAANQLLRGIPSSASSPDDYHSYSETEEDEEDSSEIYDLIERRKQAFSNGSKKELGSGRYTVLGEQEIEVSYNFDAEKQAEPKSAPSIERVPSVLSRSEAYHENASAAVTALLTPRGSEMGSVSSMSDIYAGSSSVLGASPFHSVKYLESFSTGSVIGIDSVNDDIERYDPTSPTADPLLTRATEEKLDKIADHMSDPSKTLTDLLTAIASPDDISKVDRGYMVRRKNACGALQVLTVNTRKRKQICWTVGVLPALASVLQDDVDDRMSAVFLDVRARHEYEEARKRAIAALMNLSMPAPNRLAIFHTPGLVQAVISAVERTAGDSLQGCCAVLAYLAKSPENRLLMAQVPGLFEAVIHVLEPKTESDTEDDRYSRKMLRSIPSEDESSESSYSREDSFDRDSFEADSSGAESVDSRSKRSVSSGDMSENYRRRKSSSRSRRKKAESRNAKKTKKVEACSYEEDRHLLGARKNIFAMLCHLVKERDNCYRLARVPDLVSVLVEIAKIQGAQLHVLAVQLLAHLTRHRLNNKSLVFKLQEVVPALVLATYSPSDIARKYACSGIQNFSHDKSCRQELASSGKLISALCRRARSARDPDERLAAICSLKNLTDEPANLIPMSNTPECIATLMQVAHGKEDGITPMMQFRACDALATISHWLRKIATNGQAMDIAERGGKRPMGMFVPSLQVVTWDQWQ